MSLTHAAYMLATDPRFRQSFQTNPAAAVAVPQLALSPEEQSLLTAIQQVLSLSPEYLRQVLQTAGPTSIRRWGCQ